jgi:transketolase
MATSSASGAALDHLAAAIPELLGGSADDALEQHKSEGHDRTYMHYGVREHGMAAPMNGSAPHGGLIPYGGAFLCFSDYCRPSIRHAALPQARAIFVMTHDSIGLVKTAHPLLAGRAARGDGERKLTAAGPQLPWRRR